MTVGVDPREEAQMGASVRSTQEESQREVQALLAVSRVVSEGGPLRALLDRISFEAASVVGAKAASILLLRPHNRFRLAGSYGLSSRYSAYLETLPVVEGRGPSGLVVEHREPVLIADAASDPRFGIEGVAPLEASSEGFSAMASIPLLAGKQMLGVLHVYRVTAGPWPKHQTDLLTFFGEHAANAISTARLIERQQRQVGALSRLVRALRHQTHEHANRIHTIGGLLALGEYSELQRFVSELELDHHRSYAAIAGRISNAAVAGLILAETGVAKQRGITLSLSKRSSLPGLPPRLGDPEAVMILGNLLQNALDAVERLPKARRRVAVSLSSNVREMSLRVRDWGPGIATEYRDRVFEPGFTTKSGHPGIGLELVGGAVAAAFGTVEIEHLDPGTAFVVRIPNAV